ncbi:hypothetical protein [Amycolatopsis sp.]|uniref:hypothetical protein n=1 Tax=Amycolatopsis sp. TaxID=37632 RepID=UPI002BFDBDAE|nr:hypothetical protein [Amycolatopsis sp.]HVV08445.1 hypothetical protein [Amycolatopsis sp.]
MNLTTFVDGLGREFSALAETGGPEVQEQIGRLAGSLESAMRLTLLEALSAAADEITRELAPGSVELRLRGREPDFVVTPPPPEQTGAAPPENRPEALPASEDSATARINFRLPESLKTAIEDAAAKEGRSVNAWLVHLASTALQQREREQPVIGKPGGQRFTGWVG